MTDFKKLTLDELCDKLCEKKKTIIVYHVRSDADAVGSAFALKEIFRLLGVPAVCLCSDEVPVRLRFLSEDTQGTVVPRRHPVPVLLLVQPRSRGSVPASVPYCSRSFRPGNPG